MQKLLLIEPSEFVRKIVGMHFNACGNHVTTANMADGVLEVFYKLFPDIVVMDIKLPDADGVKIVEQMKKHDPDVKIYIISENITRDQLKRLVQTGVKEYFIKPFCLDELIEKVAV